MRNGEEVVNAVDKDLDELAIESESDADSEEHVWSASGVNSGAYKRRMGIWKNEITGNG